MTQDDNIKGEMTEETTESTPDLSQWGVFFWKLIRSLAVVAAGTTAIVYICRWLIY